MPVNWQRALERAQELQDAGYSSEQIDAVLDQEAAVADAAAQSYGHQSAQAARGGLQTARGALNADAAPPGTMPDEDPITRGFKLAEDSGAQRGTDLRMQSYVEAVFEAAQRNDPRVMTEGVVDDETRRRWHEDAHRRQIANREASGMRRR